MAAQVAVVALVVAAVSVGVEAEAVDAVAVEVVALVVAESLALLKSNLQIVDEVATGQIACGYSAWDHKAVVLDHRGSTALAVLVSATVASKAHALKASQDAKAAVLVAQTDPCESAHCPAHAGLIRGPVG